MPPMPMLRWLPEHPDFRGALKKLAMAQDGAWEQAVALANSSLDFLRTHALDETLRRVVGPNPPKGLGTKPVRLAILGSSTMTHLHGAIRVAGLRRGIHVSVYEGGFGQYWQELSDTTSALHAFEPNFVLFALDAHHLAAGVNVAMDEAGADAARHEVEARLRTCWQMAREYFACPIVQQMPLPVHPLLLGNNEHRGAGARAAFIGRLSARLRQMADAEGVDVLAIDARAAHDGLAAWYDPQRWFQAKQEIAFTASPIYGELLGRLIAAKQGRSFKCLVLDLDNTLWGGVIGDDGLEGIVLGHGSALGEAYAAFQDYVRELSRRGVILAVCSKNDAANAREPFESHPEMILRLSDIACFVANWSPKVDNLRAIAEKLNIGIDSLVFLDDNPFERELIRRELPMVGVPEVGDDPSYYTAILEEAGYFEALAITEEDRARAGQYQENLARAALKASCVDLPAYLRSLEMQLIWRRFDRIGLSRTVQLINKTNQFNLTTRRYTEEEVLQVMQDPKSFGLQLRLLDRFGDNGIIAVVIGEMGQDGECWIDSWLMSCRVLGRQVEEATLDLIAEQARRLGARRLIGRYVPTSRNNLVRDHYTRLGFTTRENDALGGSVSELDLDRFASADGFIVIREG